ncbi:MAG: NFACT RNA binding domain-containing protein [Acidobacteriota bacterium]
MELVLLRRLAVALEERLAGRRIDQVYAIPRHHLALVVGARSDPRLWYSCEADGPHLYLRPGPHDNPDRPPAFAMAVRKHARGRRLDRIRLVDDDRIVEVGWVGSGEQLVLELIPRRACAFLLDDEDRVLAVWNPRRGRPAMGQRWEAPGRPPRSPVGDIGRDEWRRIAGPGEAKPVIRGLLRNVAGMTSLIATEATLRYLAGGEPLETAVREELERADEAPDEPRIYSPAPLDELAELPPSGAFFLAPFPLRAGEALVANPFDDIVEAAATFYPLRAHLELVGRARDDVTSAASSRLARTRRARDKVADDLPDEDAGAELQRRGDLLLAHADARIEGDRATVPDDYGSGEPIRIPIDPSLDRVANARRLYRRAQRARRKRQQSVERLRELDRQIAHLEELQRRVEALGAADDLEPLAARAAALELQLDPSRWRHPEADAGPLIEMEATAGADDGQEDAPAPGGARRPYSGILAWSSEDGLEILVGRNAEANDRLTHEVAARQDWWLHAEGPGSHVVVRNPERLEVPPDATLRQAAAVAAWYSRSRHDTKVEVHWTRARHVRRPANPAPGLVIMDRHRTVLARPLHPDRIFADGD